MQTLEARDSSNVGWARYEEETRTLFIDFRGKDGQKQSTYRYADFPLERWLQFNAATSKGSFFAYNIRPHYTGVKIWKREKPKPAEQPGFDLGPEKRIG